MYFKCVFRLILKMVPPTSALQGGAHRRGGPPLYPLFRLKMLIHFKLHYRTKILKFTQKQCLRILKLRTKTLLQIAKDVWVYSERCIAFLFLFYFSKKEEKEE